MVERKDCNLKTVTASALIDAPPVPVMREQGTPRVLPKHAPVPWVSEVTLPLSAPAVPTPALPTARHLCGSEKRAGTEAAPASIVTGRWSATRRASCGSAKTATAAAGSHERVLRILRMTFEDFEKRILKNLPGATHDEAVQIWTGFCRSAAKVGTDIADVPATTSISGWCGRCYDFESRQRSTRREGTDSVTPDRSRRSMTVVTMISGSR
jgi:hypothetical protein